MKLVKHGLDYVRDANWNPHRMTRETLMRYGKRTMPSDLKRLGFSVAVCDCGDYYRMSYGR